MPGDVDVKTGDLAHENLKNKHLEGQDVNAENIPIFDNCPDLIDVEVTEDAVEDAEQHISGSAGISGIN